LPRSVLGFDPLAFGHNRSHLPPGPLIVLSAAILFLVSVLLAPQQGILARLVGELRLRTRMVREHLLRSLYELSEPHLPACPVVPLTDLVDYRSWNRWLVNAQLHRAAGKGLVTIHQDAIQLTPAGLAEAARITKTHRLWELYLVQHAGIAADHVDRDADDVEHLLPRSLVEKLERRLASDGRLPKLPDAVPQSPHELGISEGAH
jgi:manganese/zinc/iron transport system permease protein